MPKTACYYYAWYSGTWGRKTVRQDDTPCLGWYDNTNYDAVLNEHMKTMKSCSDFAVLSWDPRGNGYDHVFYAADKANFPMSCLYESRIRQTTPWGRIGAAAHPAILEDMTELSHCLNEDCWFRIDGRPVVFLYITRCYENPEILIPEMRKVLGNPFLVGDEAFWNPMDPSRVALFDAITAYNMYQPGRFSGEDDAVVADSYLKSCSAAWQMHHDVCKKAGVPLWANAKPGYDDRGVRPGEKHAPIPRLAGDFFRKSLAAGAAVSTDYLMVTSFNEWFEDTQIEPAQSYGSLYADILASFRT